MMKKVVLPIALMMICALLGGCFNAGNQPEPTPAPQVDSMSSPTPYAGQNPAGTTPEPGVNGAASGFDWQAKATAVEARINMFSEIQECRVAADGNTALVGVRFAPAYRGEMTQRIRDMIAGEVMAVDSGIQVVAVTAEQADVDKIFALSDGQRAGNTPEDFKQQIDQIARNTTTLR